MNHLVPYLPYVGGFAAVLLCSSVLLMWLGHRRFRFYSGIVHGVTGDLGGGKSAFTVGKFLVPGARAIASRRGLWCSHTGRPVNRVITNFEFNPEVYGIHDLEVIQLEPHPTLSVWEQIVSHGYIETDKNGKPSIRIDALIAVDEMALFAPSDAKRIDPICKAFLVHLRKFNCQLMWIAQDHMLVHKRVRSFSQRVWYISEGDNGLMGMLPGRWFRARSWKGSQIDKREMYDPIDVRGVKLTRKLMSAYDSFETITDDLDSLVGLQVLASQAEASTTALPAPAHNRNGLSPSDFPVIGEQAVLISDGHTT